MRYFILLRYARLASGIIAYRLPHGLPRGSAFTGDVAIYILAKVRRGQSSSRLLFIERNRCAVSDSQLPLFTLSILDFEMMMGLSRRRFVYVVAAVAIRRDIGEYFGLPFCL